MLSFITWPYTYKVFEHYEDINNHIGEKVLLRKYKKHRIANGYGVMYVIFMDLVKLFE